MKTCFFISRIGQPGSPERDFSDKLLKYIIEPALKTLGYGSPKRADHITKPGIITAQIFKEISEADLVIADLTGHNPNVFYELAVRHLLKKPFVQMIRRDEKLPFDIAANRTIYFDFDVAEAAKAIAELEVMIDSAEHDPACSETPLSFAIDTLPMTKSVSDTEQRIGEALFKIQSLQAIVEETLDLTRNAAIERRKVDRLDAFLPLFDEALPLVPLAREAIRNALRTAPAAISMAEPVATLDDSNKAKDE